MNPVATFLLAALPLPHDGPADRILALTTEMARHGRTARLLHQRAICFLELRQRPSALRDLRAALRLDPRHEPSLVEQVRVLFDLGRAEPAHQAALAAAARVTTVTHRALLARVHAEILTALGRYGQALDRCQASLRALPDQPRVLLRRSILRGLLGQDRQRLAELGSIAARQPHLTPVVEEEWIDAMIALGDPRALPLVEQRLAESRYRSSWLLRRAEIAGDTENGDRDLMSALREISTRLHPTRPDLMLIADRALILHRLGGDPADDLARLRRKGYPALLQLRLRLRMGR